MARLTAHFDHTSIRGGEFFAENEKAFLSAVSCSSISRLSRLEQLPYEVMLLVLEGLDIASLVMVASVNIHVRGLSQGRPDIQKVQQNICAARAISRTYKIGTARSFSLKDFMEALTSWKCALCRRRVEFAVGFCLMWCGRICASCRSPRPDAICLPVDMAVLCCGVDREHLTCQKGFACLAMPPSAQRESCCGQLTRPGIELPGLKRAWELGRWLLGVDPCQQVSTCMRHQASCLSDPV